MRVKTTELSGERLPSSHLQRKARPHLRGGNAPRTSVDRPSAPLRKPVRARNKAHLQFVASQPCLVCQRSPCDAHHLKFAQPRSLGSKVSDEFTVPLCRQHHNELHRYGNEGAWWANAKLSPLEAARDLWEATLSGDATTLVRLPAVTEITQGEAGK